MIVTAAKPCARRLAPATLPVRTPGSRWDWDEALTFVCHGTRS